MADTSAADLVDMIIRRAPELRKAGVLTIEIGELKAQLAPHQEEVAPTPAAQSEEPVSLLDNPELYGLPKGSKLPGLSHLEVVAEKGKR